MKIITSIEKHTNPVLGEVAEVHCGAATAALRTEPSSAAPGAASDCW